MLRLVDRLDSIGQPCIHFCIALSFTIFSQLYVYRTEGNVSLSANIGMLWCAELKRNRIAKCMHLGLMILTGAIVNGPYALITTAVSADLVCAHPPGHAHAHGFMCFMFACVTCIAG